MKETENAFTGTQLDTLANIAQVVVRCTNKCLYARGHYFRHLL